MLAALASPLFRHVRQVNGIPEAQRADNYLARPLALAEGLGISEKRDEACKAEILVLMPVPQTLVHRSLRSDASLTINPALRCATDWAEQFDGPLGLQTPNLTRIPQGSGDSACESVAPSSYPFAAPSLRTPFIS